MPGILLDIEGTTTPIDFVHSVLLPYARRHLPEYVSGRELAQALDLMDRDAKSTSLKTLQGLILKDGYERGELRGVVFPDVAGALERWHKERRDVRIFSSGSILAQQLLFSTCPEGDLTRFITGYFDTTTGSKKHRASYRAIADAFTRPAPEILFASDVIDELDAARAAGMETRLCVRPGNAPVPETHGHETITTLDAL